MRRGTWRRVVERLFGAGFGVQADRFDGGHDDPFFDRLNKIYGREVILNWFLPPYQVYSLSWLRRQVIAENVLAVLGLTIRAHNIIKKLVEVGEVAEVARDRAGDI